MTAEIAATADVAEAADREQFTHRAGLVVAVFEQQPATGHQVLGRPGNDQAQVVQAIGASALLGSKRTSPALRCGSSLAM